MFRLIVGLGLALTVMIQTVLDSSHFTTTTNLGQIVLLITFLINMLMQWLREKRQRKWQLEDEQRRTRELTAHEAAMKRELAAKAEEIKQASRTRISDLGTQLDELLTSERPTNDRRRQG